MAPVPCGARIGFLVAAIIFVIVQMRLFAAEQKYALQATSSVEFEEYCQKELRGLGDKLLTQQTKLAYLEGEKIRLEREIGKLASELETSQTKSIASSAKRGMLNWRKLITD